MIASVVRRIEEIHGASSPSQSEQAGEAPLSPLVFEQITEWNQVQEAFSLLHDCYLEKGLIRKQPSGLRFTHYNLLPETGSFAALVGEKVISTLSVIPDSRGFGLPMGELYGAELDSLRKPGRKLAEISGLAVNSRYRPITILIMLNLVKVLYRYSLKVGVTDLVLACHPKHARLYQRLFLFDVFGEEKTYASVNDAPAVALRLDLTTVKGKYHELYDDDGFTLCRFLFTDEIFRCPAVSLRSGAFDHDIVNRLLSIQPNIAHVLESVQKGMVSQLTGKEPAGSFLQAGCAGLAEVLASVPAFVPA